MIPSIALCNIKYQPQLLSSANIGLVCVKFIYKRPTPTLVSYEYRSCIVWLRYTYARESEIAQEEELEVFGTTFAPHTMLVRFLFWNLQPRQ